MKFEEAVEVMKQGKKVRRKSWGNKLYNYLISENYMIIRNGNIKTENNLVEIEGDDWEIYEDKKTLSDKEHTCSNRGDNLNHGVFDKEDVKESLKEFLKWCKNDAGLSRGYFTDTINEKAKEIFGEELI